jgi:hypothetical protein
MQHLSHSSYSHFLLCPDDWRRHYLKGEPRRRAPRCSSAAASTTTLSTYYRQLLEQGQTLTLDQLCDAYRDHWTRELAAEHAKRGVRWDASSTSRAPSPSASTRSRSPRLRPTAIFTGDVMEGLRYADAVRTGLVSINETTNYWENHLPFGGRAGGGHALERLTELQTIVIG